MLGRWRSRLERFVEQRTNNRQLQFDIDFYRLSVLALLHQGVDAPTIEQRLLSMRPQAHYQLAYRYYLSETQRLLSRVHADTAGAGVANVYPAAVAALQSPTAAPLAGDAVMARQQRRDVASSKRAAAHETRRHAHPDGFALVIQRSSIVHDEAGYGVFVDGTARAGQLLALYAGRVVAPPELSAQIVERNDYMVSFYSGWIIDGREWFRRGANFDERLASVIDAGMAPPTSLAPTLPYRNPLGVGSLVNHAPPNVQPNVAFCELEIDPKELAPEVAMLLPNDVAPPSSLTSRFVWHEADGGKRRTMALVALREVRDGELFLNYRLNPALAVPDWYWQPDVDAAARRWTRPTVF